MEMTIKLREQLKKILAEKNLKVAVLAREAKVPVATVHGWLQGKPPKNFNQVKAVCDILNVSLDWLLYAEQPKTARQVLEDHKDEIVAGVWEVVLRKPQK
ncbi:helix-turn-helix transcriptional regulator [Bdellovibrio sp.]|uniref:helix-turn-helix domain-containing protein n=1 Tax=Bdellovibrio sp. TaxID=28201 RepID=UPI00322144BD